jgi:hypothetical protein
MLLEPWQHKKIASRVTGEELERLKHYRRVGRVYGSKGELYGYNRLRDLGLLGQNAVDR